MGAPAVPVDVPVARFVARTLTWVADVLADRERLALRLQDQGTDAAAADSVQAHLSAHAGDLQDLAKGVTALSGLLSTPHLDGARLVATAVPLWTALRRLVDGAGAEAKPALERLVTAAIEQELRSSVPLVWAVALGLGLVGEGQAPIEAVQAAVSDPVAYAWGRFLAMRRLVQVRIAGLVTGPRATALAVSDLGDGLPVPAALAAVAPGATRIVQRLAFELAADTFGTGWPLTLDVLAAEGPAFAGVAVTAGPLVDEGMRLGERLTLGLTPGNQPMSVVVTGWGAVRPVVAGPPALTLSLAQAGTPRQWRFGADGGPRLELGEPRLAVRVGASDWQAEAGFERLELVIPPQAVAPVLDLLLPAGGIRFGGRLVFQVDRHGLHADGSADLTVRCPQVVRLPGMRLMDLQVGAEVSGNGLRLLARGTARIELGPLVVIAEGLGVAVSVAPARPGRANLGLLDLGAPEIRLPDGLGVRIDTPLLRGGGLLRRIPGTDEIGGALELTVALGSAGIGVKAFGVFGSVDRAVSFVVVLAIEFNPPIELFLGLTLNGIGGVFGLNRGIHKDELTAMVRSGRSDGLLFPDDVVGRAPAIIDLLRKVFPAKRDQVVVGPMLKLGWGRPTSFVTAVAGVILTFPDPTLVVLLGRVLVVLPDDKLPLVHLRADFAGLIDLSSGDTSFDASLVDSRIGTFVVSGDLALRAGPQGFVFTAGGFHPRFPPPASVGAVRRLSIEISQGGLLTIWAEAYVAVTASTLQFGARAFVRAELGPIRVRGQLGFDTLFRTDPRLHFLVEVSGEFVLSFEGEELLGARLEVLLQGPGRWRARAHASITLLFIEVSGTLDLAWGDEEPAIALRAEDPVALIQAALTPDAVWTPTVTSRDAAVVQLRDGAKGLHPLGTMRIAQTAVPMGVVLDRVGNSPVTDRGPVALTLKAGTGRVDVTQDLFAVAQYVDLHDEDRLSQPAFVPMDSGWQVSAGACAGVGPRSDEVVYEEDLGEAPGPRRFGMTPDGLIRWSAQSAVGRAREALGPPPAPPSPVRVVPPRWLLADAASGRAVAALAAPQAVLAAVRVRSVDRVVLEAHEVRA